MDNSCPLGLQYVFLVQVSHCQFCFSHFGFWSGDFFLIAPFPDHCLSYPSNFHLGENGKGVLIMREDLTKAQQKEWDFGNDKHGYNKYISDMISIHRTLPDIRAKR